MTAADQTILASALPTIASSLHGFSDLSWVIVAYLLAATIAAPLYGHLSDHFGRRMLMIALAVFTLASAGCAWAPTLLALIVARGVQGLGGGGLMTLAQALIGEHVAPRERGRFAGYFAIVFTVSSTTGPILGALLFMIATSALLYALSSGGHRYAWTGTTLLLLLLVAGISYALLWVWESRVTHPVIPIRFAHVRAIIRSDAVVICFAATLFGTILYLPLYLQLGRGVGIGASGLLLLPITLTMALVSSLVGRAITRTGYTARFPVPVSCWLR